MAKGKFAQYTEAMAIDLESLLIRSVRSAMRVAIEAAAKATKQDSSNAVVHWLIGMGGQGRMDLGEFRNVRDFRGRYGRGKSLSGKRPPKLPVVGYRGDNRSGRSKSAVVIGTRKAMAASKKDIASASAGTAAAVRFVTDRARDLLASKVQGKDRIDRFFLYNAVALKAGDYKDNAGIEDAGKAGLDMALHEMNRQMTAGKSKGGFK